MKKLLVLVATLAMVVVSASPALAQGNAVAQDQYDEKPGGTPGEPVTATGVVEALGPTAFAYGTHSLEGSGYVIESDAVDLSAYEGQEVAVSGTLVYEEGELEGGPPLINVESVEPTGGEDPGEPGEPVSLSGVIEPLEVTSFQYGTHTVVNDADGSSYALQSDSIALEEFEGIQAEISGTLIAGYEDEEVEGGPPLVEVTSVEPTDNGEGEEPTDPPNNGGDVGSGNSGSSGSGSSGSGSSGSGSSGSGSSGSGGSGSGGSAAAASGGILPDTGGASLVALGAGALLIGGGLLARRIVR